MRTKVKEHPKSFTPDKLKAIQDGRATQFREPIKAKDADKKRGILLPTLLQNVIEWREQNGRWYGLEGYETLVYADAKYRVGNRLWVRETWTPDHAAFYPHFPVVYKADNGYDYERNESGEVYSPEQKAWYPYRWRSSIHMPRWASRLTLEVTNVRVQRIQDISEEDAIAEGVTPHIVRPGKTSSYQDAFVNFWQFIYGADSWAANHWVWAYTFRRIE